MKGWIVRDWGRPEDMALEDLPVPVPGEGEALVKVSHAALNFFDLLMIGGKYQVKPPFPFTPGCELAGEVVEVGPGSDFAPGDRVCAQPRWGAFAEYALVENDSANRVPDGVSLLDASAIPVVYPTAHIALGRRGRLKAGEWLLVTAGAGGVGLAAIQIGRAWGARVIALAGGEEKCRICRENGAELALDYRHEGWIDSVREATGGHGADVVFDPVGGAVFNDALKVIAWEGRAVIIGFAGGEIQRIAANRLLLKNASAVGAVWGGYLTRDPGYGHEVVADCFAMHRRGDIRPVIMERYPLARLPQALVALGERRTYGKLVVEM